jgi:hypothetical protein
MVAPAPFHEQSKWVPGRYVGMIKIVGDIIAPLDEPWEALTSPQVGS